jgi:hypothetical protein
MSDISIRYSNTMVYKTVEKSMDVSKYGDVRGIDENTTGVNNYKENTMKLSEDQENKTEKSGDTSGWKLVVGMENVWNVTGLQEWIIKELNLNFRNPRKMLKTLNYDIVKKNFRLAILDYEVLPANFLVQTSNYKVLQEKFDIKYRKVTFKRKENLLQLLEKYKIFLGCINESYQTLQKNIQYYETYKDNVNEKHKGIGYSLKQINRILYECPDKLFDLYELVSLCIKFLEGIQETQLEKINNEL